MINVQSCVKVISACNSFSVNISDSDPGLNITLLGLSSIISLSNNLLLSAPRYNVSVSTASLISDRLATTDKPSTSVNFG